MRRSTVFSLPLQLVFPVINIERHQQVNPRGEAVNGTASRRARISRRQHRTHEPLAAVAVDGVGVVRGRAELSSGATTHGAAAATS